MVAVGVNGGVLTIDVAQQSKRVQCSWFRRAAVAVRLPPVSQMRGRNHEQTGASVGRGAVV